MPNSHDQFDDYDDMPVDRQGKSKGGLSIWAIVLICAIPIGVALLIGGALAWFTMHSAPVARAEAQATRDEARVMVADGPAMGIGGPAAKGKVGIKRVYTRAEFNALIGSTPEDVTASVGPPEAKTIDGTRTIWHYRNKTVDKPASDIMDPVTQVVFDGGVVVQLNYQP